MRLREKSPASGFARSARRRRAGSVLVIVLWIAFGLVSLALYFANAMSFELRAADNRVSAQAADQAIESAVRYLNYLLTAQISNGSNGVLPSLEEPLCQAVPVGEAHYWLISRDTNNPIGPGQVCFGLVDEAAKLNLNSAEGDTLIWLPRMTEDLTQAILDWRDTNGNGPTVIYYAMQQPAYQCKCDLFETVDELRLLYGADMDTLLGEDANRNGVLMPLKLMTTRITCLIPGAGVAPSIAASRIPSAMGPPASTSPTSTALPRNSARCWPRILARRAPIKSWRRSAWRAAARGARPAAAPRGRASPARSRFTWAAA